MEGGDAPPTEAHKRQMRVVVRWGPAGRSTPTARGGLTPSALGIAAVTPSPEPTSPQTGPAPFRGWRRGSALRTAC